MVWSFNALYRPEKQKQRQIWLRYKTVDPDASWLAQSKY